MANSDSSSLSDLMNFLEGHGVNLISEVRGDRSPPVDFALFVSADRVGERVGKAQTSHRQMSMLRHAIKRRLGLEVEWIVTPDRNVAALEPALLQLLEAKHPGAVGAVIISSPKTSPVYVWVEPNPKAANRPDLTAVEMLVKEFLKLYGIESPILIYGEGENSASKPMILRALKVHAPLKTDHLTEVLRAAGSTVPSSRWLQNKLDALRKQGLVGRSSDGDYTLTELGLQVVPHGPYRSSSDVQRALVIAGRKW